jgi:hypothetical protein
MKISQGTSKSGDKVIGYGEHICITIVSKGWHGFLSLSEAMDDYNDVLVTIYRTRIVSISHLEKGLMVTIRCSKEDDKHTLFW